MRTLFEILSDLEYIKNLDDILLDDSQVISEAMELLRQQGKELHEAHNALLIQATLIGDLVQEKKALKQQNDKFKENLSI